MADDGLVTLTASEAAAEIARGAVSAETPETTETGDMTPTTDA